jgi:hypothetical protein
MVATPLLFVKAVPVVGENVTREESVTAKVTIAPCTSRPEEFLTVAVAVTGVPYDKTLEERLSEIWLVINIVVLLVDPVIEAVIVSDVPQPLSV